MMRQLVRALVELSIGQPPVLEHHGDRVWRSLDLLLKKLVNAVLR